MEEERKQTGRAQPFPFLWYTYPMKINGTKEMRQFGLQLAEELAPGSVIALSGDLGAGKTTLTQAIAEGLGVREPVSSPTFLLIKEYDSGRLPLYHFDVYRLDDPDELLELGYEDYFYGDGVCVIEWADRIEDLLPEDALRFRLSYGEDEDQRTITKE